MRSFILLLLGCCQLSGQAFSQEADSTIVSQLNRDWIASYTTHDTATMERILAPDFLMISPNGAKLTRKDIIRNVGSAEVASTATIDSASVRVFGNTALIVAWLHFTVQAKGQAPEHGTNCYSDLYIKRYGIWQAVAAHVTVLGAR